MPRINYEDVDKYSSGSDTEFLKLENDGDMATVQLLVTDMQDLDIFACHNVKVGTWDDGNDKTRFVNCLRNYDDPLDACPLCAAGLKTQTVMMLSMYDLGSGKVKIWNRGKTFIPKIKNLVNRWGSLKYKPVDIIRNGRKGDKNTRYDIQISPAEPFDGIDQVEKPEFLGGYIMNKSTDEMQTYLDTGEFPNIDDVNEDTIQQRRRNTEPLPRRNTGSRAASRRAGY